MPEENLPRAKKLERDLSELLEKFSLTYAQRTILNHYIRTPVQIIQGIIDNRQEAGKYPGDFKQLSPGQFRQDEIEIIFRELAELAKAVELINKQGEQENNNMPLALEPTFKHFRSWED